ncbi:MAG TPA: dihydrodipicolinate synthase family protein [Verrucomicrobiae bacterium]|nr:dihydrodipicolinate synthase family protein [Verrucomicrobiae bacterium]
MRSVAPEHAPVCQNDKLNVFALAGGFVKIGSNEMSTYSRFLTGLIAAPHTAMNVDGSVNLGAIEKQAARLLADGVNGAFICGSTGEGHSLSTGERQQVAERWREVIGSAPLKLIVHAGHNSIEEAKQLAAHARKIGADAVSVMSPCYFKPATVEDLIDFCAPIAANCADLPFYFYDIPVLTGVNLSMVELLRKTDGHIPNLAGIKFTSTNLMSLQECLEFEDGRFNILFGCDEMLLSALALGVPGAVGSTYNYCAPLYYKIIAAHAAGDTEAAQALQMKSVKLVQVLMQHGVLAAGKALMSLVGAECGPVRPPLRRLTEEQKTRLFRQVEALGILEPVTAARVH